MPCQAPVPQSPVMITCLPARRSAAGETSSGSFVQPGPAGTASREPNASRTTFALAS